MIGPRKGTQVTVTVAGKSSVDIPPGTLNSALKQAGLKKPE
jgi:predicted RNA binding protein YcfA (HicA-like mRNA interferase family)